MRVIFTEDALRDLDDILVFIRSNYPQVFASFETRLRLSIKRIGSWPESAPRIAERPDLRVVSLTPYPYRLFYAVTGDAVHVVHLCIMLLGWCRGVPTNASP